MYALHICVHSNICMYSSLFFDNIANYLETFRKFIVNSSSNKVIDVLYIFEECMHHTLIIVKLLHQEKNLEMELFIPYDI